MMAWHWNAHLRFCEEKYIPLHVACYGLLGLFRRANYKILMWFWTLLFSLWMCSNLGIKSGFLAAVCQLQKCMLSYVVAVIKNIWSAMGEEGDPERRKVERPDSFFCCSGWGPKLPGLSHAAYSCWEDHSRWRICPLQHCPLQQGYSPFGDLILSMVLVMYWSGFIIHLNQHHISLSLDFFSPLKLAPELSSPSYWRFGDGR